MAVDPTAWPGAPAAAARADLPRTSRVGPEGSIGGASPPPVDSDGRGNGDGRTRGVGFRVICEEATFGRADGASSRGDGSLGCDLGGIGRWCSAPYLCGGLLVGGDRALVVMGMWVGLIDSDRVGPLGAWSLRVEGSLVTGAVWGEVMMGREQQIAMAEADLLKTPVYQHQILGTLVVRMLELGRRAFEVEAGSWKCVGNTVGAADARLKEVRAGEGSGCGPSTTALSERYAAVWTA